MPIPFSPVNNIACGNFLLIYKLEIKSNICKLVAIFDFDQTIMKKPEGGNIQGDPIDHTINLFKVYLQLGYRVCIVTGRAQSDKGILDSFLISFKALFLRG